MKKFPSTIYVQVDDNSEEKYLIINEEVETADEGKIAIYILEDVKTLKISRKLV